MNQEERMNQGLMQLKEFSCCYIDNDDLQLFLSLAKLELKLYKFIVEWYGLDWQISIMQEK